MSDKTLPPLSDNEQAIYNYMADDAQDDGYTCLNTYDIAAHCRLSPVLVASLIGQLVERGLLRRAHRECEDAQGGFASKPAHEVFSGLF